MTTAVVEDHMRYPTCSLCGSTLTGHFCTTNVCQDCCEDFKCPIKKNCVAYPKVLEEVIMRIRKEKSKGV